MNPPPMIELNEVKSSSSEYVISINKKIYINESIIKDDIIESSCNYKKYFIIFILFILLILLILLIIYKIN